MEFFVTVYKSNGYYGKGYKGKLRYPCMVLVTDIWNDDFKYETLFKLYYYRVNNSKRVRKKFIGDIKIMKKGCNITRDNMPLCFEKLEDSFCSLGQSVNFYKNLHECFDEKEALRILNALNDCALSEEVYMEFENEDIFNYSLLRFSEAYKALKEAKNIILDKSYSNEFYFKYRNQFTDSEQEYEIEFDFRPYSHLPNRINVLIGKNGAGKTNLLSNLASNLSGIKKNNGFIDENQRPQFSKYIVISYNLFDDFNSPFEFVKDRKDILKTNLCKIERSLEEIKYNNKSTEVYKLISNIDENIKLLEGYLELKKTDLESSNRNSLFSYIYCGLKTDSGLITLKEMKENLLKTIKNIKKKNRVEKWKSILIKTIRKDNILDNMLDEGTSNDIFDGLSSGESIMVFVISSIISNIEEESLIIFDEPEVHLHPNAVCYFMKMFNELLVQFNSYAIIATHSSLIVQEVPSRYVTILNKSEDGVTSIEKLPEEYFGENISNITNYIFDIAEHESNYKAYLRKMSQDDGLKKEEIMAVFDNKLSYNALIYLNSLYN